jgi:hypothetical protein
MTREDIIRWAREAGLGNALMHDGELRVWIEGANWHHEIERFAALVAEAERAAEREAICPIVYGLCISDNNAQEIVNAIRARGSK